MWTEKRCNFIASRWFDLLLLKLIGSGMTTWIHNTNIFMEEREILHKSSQCTH